MTTVDRPHVFISFSSKDEKQARAICDDMERRGVPCWISSRDVRPGRNYQTEIIEAIRSASHLLLVFSVNATRSEEISRELSLASKHQVGICPVRIEDAQPAGGMEFMLATSQWVDAFRDWKDAMDRVAHELSGTTAPRPPPPPEPSRLPLLAGAALAGLVALGPGGYFLTHRHSAAPPPLPQPVAAAPPVAVAPANTGPDPAAILARVNTLAQGLTCAGATAVPSADGGLTLSGFVGTQADAQQLVTAAKPLPVQNDLDVQPWPFCAARAFGPALGARDDMPIDINRPDGRYALGDGVSGSFIVSGVEPMWVRLELLDSDGTVTDLLRSGLAKDAIGPGERVIFGTTDPKSPDYLAASPPTGPELLMVIASDKPLPPSSLGAEASARTYLPALHDLLAQSGATLAVSTRRVTVVRQQ